MTKPELKEFIKKCLLEILSEDFIKKTINESIADKIKIDVQIPGMSSSSVIPTSFQKPQQVTKKPITEDMRQKMRKIVSGDDEEVPLGTQNPKIAEAINKIQDPILKEMAKDTVNRESTKTEQQMSFSDVEKNFIDFGKISAISEALEK